MNEKIWKVAFSYRKCNVYIYCSPQLKFCFSRNMLISWVFLEDKPLINIVLLLLKIRLHCPTFVLFLISLSMKKINHKEKAKQEQKINTFNCILLNYHPSLFPRFKFFRSVERRKKVFLSVLIN